MNSLLVNVSKYASSDKTSPIENFITEAFAWLLKNDEEVRINVEAFIQKKAKGKDIELKSMTNSDNINTQVNYNGVYPDMEWTNTAKDFRIIFEHKVWSELHHNQLESYRKYAKNHYDNFIIVLITAHTAQHRQNPDIALCWYDIEEILSSLNPDDNYSDSKQDWIRQEFIQLLESCGLINRTPINPLAISYYYDVKNIDTTLSTLSNRHIGSHWPLCEDSPQAEFITPTKSHEAWGRIGLEFFSSEKKEGQNNGWKPAIFCGFIINDSIHDVKDLIDQYKSPLAVLIISISDTLHKDKMGDYEDSYKILVDELSEKLPSGWKISDRTTKNKFNRYHPLIIYQDIESFFSNSFTLEKQSNAFITQFTELQNLLIDTQSFIPFCRKLQSL